MGRAILRSAGEEPTCGRGVLMGELDGMGEVGAMILLKSVKVLNVSSKQKISEYKQLQVTTTFFQSSLK